MSYQIEIVKYILPSSTMFHDVLSPSSPCESVSQNNIGCESCSTCRLISCLALCFARNELNWLFFFQTNFSCHAPHYYSPHLLFHTSPFGHCRPSAICSLSKIDFSESVSTLPSSPSHSLPPKCSTTRANFRSWNKWNMNEFLMGIAIFTSSAKWTRGQACKQRASGQWKFVWF